MGRAGPVGPVAQPGHKWLRYRLKFAGPLSLSSPFGLVGPTQEKNFIGPLTRPGLFRGLR